MYKRILMLCFCLFLLAGMAVPAFADEPQTQVTEPVTMLKIATAEEFLAFAENCRLDSYSRNLEVTLEADINLHGYSFSCVPVFSGTFDGNGHSITGMALSGDGSMQGLFRHLTDTALVKELTVSGTVCPGGSASQTGGIAGRNEGRILNCVFTGSVSGTDAVGGIAGINAVTGMIENCRVDGQIQGNHFVGGLAGENSGVIRESENLADVNTTAQQNTVEITDITLETLTNTEAVNTVTDIGGIAGSSTGVIRSCRNSGQVGYPHMGYNIGGIAGTQSGYIAGCENRGSIQGRKEVGGIVGQMEPATMIEFSEDTLQILKGQLDTMSGLVNRATGNAQANAANITGQIVKLQTQTQTARDAVQTLFPSQENGIPDTDTVLAAQNTLTDTLGAMPNTVRSIASATQSTVNALSRDLGAISGQIGAMGQTLNGASENLGGTISDVSDQDTPELLSGKVEDSRNRGAVLADLNAGGIAGAMAMENDLDVLEDWQQYGEESLNFSSEVRAVVLACENSATVTGKHQNAGGIVGGQLLGLVKDTVNTGAVEASQADYAGGISGLSTGFIRASYARCSISGKTCVGGIAGSATVVSDSISQVRIEDAREKQGAILGIAEEAEGENPIQNNYYLSGQPGMGAVDGISYAGQAEPVELNVFLELENLPESFRRVTVSFLFEDGKTQEVLLVPGDALEPEQIPAVPEKEGHSGNWEGLADADLTNVLFDLTFRAQYRAYQTVIASAEKREDGRPLLLLEGLFADGDTVSLSRTQEAVILQEGQTLLETWELTASGQGSVARFLLPVDSQPQQLQLLLGDGEGNWSTASTAVDGSYLVFAPHADTYFLALVQVAEDRTLLWAAAITGGVLLVALPLILVIRNKKKKAKQSV